MKQNVQKNKVVSGKTPIFVIDSFWTPQSICLQFCTEILRFQSYFQLKMVLQFFEKVFRLSEYLCQSWSIEKVQNFHWLWHKSRPISQTEGYFENL